MDVLLLRPVPGNERFGLGPFFRIEPLGMEYIAAALEARGHRVTLADLRFSRSLEHQLRTARPGAGRHRRACTRSRPTTCSRSRADVRALSPDVPIVVGGHTAAAYPEPFLVADVDRRRARRWRARAAAVVRRARARHAADERAGARAARTTTAAIVRTAGDTGTLALDEVPLPARHHVAPWRRQYACLAHRPAWLVETARGCPFRCSFCSIWQLHARAVRERSIDSVCRDFASVGDHVFVADDLFWHHPSRSLELARELRRRGIRKQWILVQSRVDLVARHPELLEAWRPLAQDFDIFFGLEAATNEGLDGLMKDATVDRPRRASRWRGALDYGVTGNFVIDPAWSEADFERLWAFVERHRCFRPASRS